MMKRMLAALLTVIVLTATAVLSGCNFVDVKDPAETDPKGEDSSAPVTDPADEEEPYDYDLSEYIEVGQYLGIEVGVVSPEVSQNQIDSAIANLLSQNATYTTITDRPAKADDTLTIDYVGTINDIPFEGGTGSGKSITLTGNGGYIDGFADGLIGASIGETVDLHLTFPEDYFNTAYAGKDCVFKVTVKAITETILPEYNDAFVASISDDYATAEEYTQYIKDSLYEQNKELCESAKQSAIWEKIMDSVNVLKYPDKEVNYLYDSYISQITAMLEAYDYTLEYYVTTYTIFDSVAAFQEEIMTESKAYVAEEMTLYYLLREANVTLTESEFQQGAAHYAQLTGYGTADALIQAYGKAVVEQNILFDKLFTILTENAIETPSEMTIDELIAKVQ